MATTTLETIIKQKPQVNKVLSAILKELHSLRQEISLVLPQEDLKEYSHSMRIKHSYKKALKQYPPEF
ncbi:hypothetical protein COS33_00805 [Candidatus Wolfebacteria bacterium CG02_land_8_20_14_3_00_37_12]|uniref:Uncharacterized protein n=3 Tax=Candidatus Wolfeibacteriota TaxID=1752735 RepID=A0A2M7Q8S9_9BACT|nr:MAG: hypothetical protein COS33_00805 [Candidatus Wolfebacteria bacterium CG02_land_8_20_14_3_00_37_12]PIY59475.1 MAG: hypothetical protein COY96_01680 [Candidatus Wolfebacteria bacterium CG_4_10_14_0_8_um_filter_37_11]PJA41728.1 MAG: hypothetical protein CO177_00915 [Candidatus Wolfebacteria bacterium CG_4_9_14_3_um_filter_37_9]